MSLKQTLEDGLDHILTQYSLDRVKSEYDGIVYRMYTSILEDLIEAIDTLDDLEDSDSEDSESDSDSDDDSREESDEDGDDEKA